MKTRITKGRIWLEGRLQEMDILIDASGKIKKILPPHEVNNQPAKNIIDAQNNLVLPGSIDAHAHIQDGAETFYPGSCAAAAGGVTTVVDMPPFHVCSTAPGLLSRMKTASEECVTDFSSHGGIVVQMDDLTHMHEVTKAGAAGFKLFMPAAPPVTREVMWQAVQTAAKTGLRLVVHAEESACFETEVDWSDPMGFANARPPVAESSAAAFLLDMADAAGAPIHICHVSSGRTAELIARYRAKGTDVTAETTPHFLIFHKEDFNELGACLKTTPPLRDVEDNEILWQALSDGVIDMVISDHFLGELPQANKNISFEEKGAGIAGLEISMPLLYHHGVHEGRLSLKRFVEVTAERPAEVFGFGWCKGTIKPGMDADLVILDPNGKTNVSVCGNFSRALTLPYNGWQLTGKVKHTFVRGIEVWNGDTILAEKGTGRFIARKN